MTHEENMQLQRTNTTGLSAITKEVKSSAAWILGLGAIMWLLEIVDTVVLSGALDRYGIAPRSLDGLLGILAAPFLHGGFGHLISNTAPLVIFSALIMLKSKREWLWASALSVLGAGVGTWLFGAAGSVHIGASGLVFGLFGYLLLSGIFERRWLAIVLSLFVGITYGSMLFGAVPFMVGPGISWEGHLFGFIGGGMASWMAHGNGRSKRKQLTE